ncbi:hypothetical protein ACFSR9_04415 [Deinococcus taklimakanensis]|uniref:Uncharacterized protein n=1 Tax=Deinococcus taklimakanensis TaxID=536443 RepID=A0ABW5P0D4_9DEIO
MLVLDLDPQTNATLALVGEERWAKADTEGQTLRAPVSGPARRHRPL